MPLADAVRNGVRIKRRSEHGAVIVARELLDAAGDLCAEADEDTAPVSYTHLDVYKRQHSFCADIGTTSFTVSGSSASGVSMLLRIAR